jgi:pimeloyl-ACP methyl ester carboxylesterase
MLSVARMQMHRSSPRHPQLERSRSHRRAAGVAALGAALAVSAPLVFAVDHGLMRDARFSDYTPAASSSEIARRQLTPLAFERIRPRLADATAQPIDLAQERFVVYVPQGEPPPQGYGLFVFIPPWPEPSLPRDWPHVLDRHDLIFVSAARSGNDADTLDRRVPLALLGYENIRRRYRLDANRTYVGGFSGGSRVALRVALAYPDIFRGVLLNSGSDPLGGEGIALPPPVLFHRFQDSTRLVFVTGDRDEVNLHHDLVSRSSLRERCVFDVASMTMPRTGHAVASAAGLDRALKALDESTAVDAKALASCRADFDRALAAKISEADAAISAGDRDRATEILRAIDSEYGGMAATGIASLQSRLDAR